MDVEVRVAKTPSELDDVFQLRYNVFVGEERRMESSLFPDGRIFDRFDTYEHNANLIAYVDGAPIGTARVTTDSPLGVALDDHYDLRSLRMRCIDEDGSQRPTAVTSMLAVSRQAREAPGVAGGLLKAIGAHLQLSGLTDIVAIVNPMIVPLLEGFGMRKAGEPFLCPRVQQHLVPMHGRSEIMPASSRRLPALPPSSITLYYQAGEVITRAGSVGRASFAIVHGEVDLVAGEDPEEGILLGTVSAGGVFGGDMGVKGTVVGYSAIAKTPCELRLVEHEDILDHAIERRDRLKALLGKQHTLAMSASRIAGKREVRPMTGLSLFDDYLVARVLHVLMDMGFFDVLGEDGWFTAPAMAKALGVPGHRLTPLFDYLVSVGSLDAHRGDGDRRLRLDPAVRSRLEAEMGYVQWLLGGYDGVLDNLESLVREHKTYGKEIRRDDRAMAAATARISRAFTDAHMYELLALDGVETIADIGCGSGKRLIEICRRHPELRGIGLDISPDCCALARQNVAEAGMSDRIRIVEGPAQTWLRNEGARIREAGEVDERGQPKRPADLVLCFAMFHDLFNIDGVAKSFLEDIKAGVGDGGYLMIQDQLRLPDSGCRESPSWVPGFTLVHHLMNQQLFLRQEYEALFKRVGMTLLRRVPTAIPENWIFLMRT